jgi:competence protein ComEC
MLARESLFVRAVFLVMLGFAAATMASRVYGTNMLDWPTRATVVKATVVDVEQHKSGRRLLLEDVSIDKLPAYRTGRRLRLVMPRRLDKQAPDIKPGQHIEGVAKVMPFSEPMTPDGFDFRRNAFFQGIGATGYLMGKIRISEAAGQSRPKLAVWFAQVRQNLQAMIKQHLQGDRAGLAIILITGDKTSLSPETTQAMRSVGLAHLLAIAGLHIGLVAGIIFFFVRALLALFPFVALRFPIKKWAAALAFLAIVFFTLQVGAPVPTRRALIMTSVVLLGIMMNRVSLSLRTVTLAAFLILLVWPQMLLHPAFQLSFAAVLGLISVGEAVRKRGWNLFPERRGFGWTVLRHVIGLAGMSVVATLATLPFSLYHFQEGEVYSVLANTLAIPLTSFWLMPLCVMTEILWLFGLEAWPLKLLDPGLGLLIGLSHKIASFPGAHYNPPPMPMTLLAVCAFGGLFFCLTTGRKRFAGLAALLVALYLGSLEPRPFMLVSPDGKEAGVWREEPSTLVVTSTLKKPDKFIAKYWGERFGLNEDGIRFIKGEDDGDPTLTCDEARCVAQKDGATVAWIRDPAILPQECVAGHDLIINGVNYEGCSATNSLVLTRESFKQRGAHAVYVEPQGLRIRTSRQGRALRPWSVGWRWDK